jgi:amidase
MTTTDTDTVFVLQSATELSAALRHRQISSRELLTHYRERIDRLNPAINAVVTLDDTAFERAAQADAALASGETLEPLRLPRGALARRRVLSHRR